MIVDGIIIIMGIVVIFGIAIVVKVLEDIEQVLKSIRRRIIHASRSGS